MKNVIGKYQIDLLLKVAKLVLVLLHSNASKKECLAW